MTSKKSSKKSFVDKVISFLGSKTFFGIVLTIFLIQGVWFARSAAFPMIYDEFHHANAVQFFTENRNPFNLNQTNDDTLIYGDLTRASSYLYYYILSFFNIFITNFSGWFYTQITFLRIVNVIFVLLGLIVYRKLLLQLGVGRASTNIAILVTTLIPIFPYLAAHINYDNLLFLVSGLFLLYGSKVVASKKISYVDLSLFYAIGFMSTVVKNSFLPVVLTGFIYITIVSVYRLTKGKQKIKKIWKKTPKAIMSVSLLFLLLSVGLFSERYVKNYIDYGTVSPKCEKIQDYESCINQPINRRNRLAREKQEENPQKIESLASYTVQTWIPTMVISNGSVSVASIWNDFETRAGFSTPQRLAAEPLSFLVAIFWLMLAMSLLFIAYSWRELRKLPGFMFMVILFTIYTLSLLLFINYPSYQKTAIGFAIQPRYLLIFYPIFIGYSIKAFDLAVKSKYIKLSFLVLGIYALSQGGGMLTYLVSSDPNWYWQGENIIKLNIDLKEKIAPYILSSEHVELRKY